MGFNLDTAQRSQVQTPVNRRSIYDASTGEVFGKSLVAGFALGLGNALATALFFGVIAGLLVTTVTPLLDKLNIPWNDLQVVLQQQVNPTVSPATTPTTTTTVGE